MIDVVLSFKDSLHSTFVDTLMSLYILKRKNLNLQRSIQKDEFPMQDTAHSLHYLLGNQL